MDENKYYKEIYSKFWVNQTKKYGYSTYEQNIVRLVSKSTPKKVFEVGIGTGWPIGNALKESGIEVDGCDIAESSVVLAQKELKNENGIWVGDVLEYKGDILYDVVYCVRSSWYIPNFYSTVRKMVSMTKPGGYIIFDVMNKNSLYCLNIRWNDIKERYYRFLGIDKEKRFGTNFVSLLKMKRFLKQNRVSFNCYLEREITHNKDVFNTPKVVFYCRKEI